MLVWPGVTLWGEPRILVPTFRDKLFSGADVANYNFSQIAIGSAPAAGHTRHVVVIAMAVSTGAANAFSDLQLLFGDFSSSPSMTIVENFSVVIDGQRYKAVVGIHEMPTQTTVGPAVSFTANQMECSVALWTLEDLLSATARDVRTNSVDDLASISVNVDIPGGGICVAMAHVENPQDWTSFTGTGANLRENSNSTIAIDVRPEVFQDELLLTADPVAATIDQVVIAASFL